MAGSGDARPAAIPLLLLVNDAVTAALGRCDVLMTTEQYAGLTSFPLASFDAVIHYLPTHHQLQPADLHPRQHQGDKEQQAGDDNSPPIMRYLLGVELPGLAALSVLAGEAVTRGGRVAAKYPRQPQQQLVARRLPFTVTSTPPPHPEDMALSEAATGNDGPQNRCGGGDSGNQQQHSNCHWQQCPANSIALPEQCQQPLPQEQPPFCCSGCPLVINSSPQSLMRSRRALYEALLTLEATGAAAPLRLGGGEGGGAIVR